MTTRVRVSAMALKALWMSDVATGIVHDHSTREVVVELQDGTTYACTFEEHAAHLGRGADS